MTIISMMKTMAATVGVGMEVGWCWPGSYGSNGSNMVVVR